jgi:cytochrome c-type biogenesis protein CcmF
MVAEIGFGSLFVTLIVALYGLLAALYGLMKKQAVWVYSARQSMRLVFPLLTIPSVALLYLLGSDHFDVVYVYEVSSRSMPLYLKLTALWAGQAGSLLFWSWLLAGFISALALRKWDRDRELLPWVIVVNLATLAFFLVINIFFENPFLRYWQDFEGVQMAFARPLGTIALYPPDGSGLNAYLRHPGMILHPPLQYLGFVGFIIPFSIAMGSLAAGRTDDRWIRLSRPWVMWAWLFLSLGLVMGARWAYDVLGWGGYWGWDPVEIASLMPWLSGTAYLHAALIHEKRGAFKGWSLILVTITYLLVIYGTFITRSPILSSVHTFAQSNIGWAFLIFLFLTIFLSVWLIGSRWESLRSDLSLQSYFSREALIVISMVLFLGLLATAFWGVLFPILSDWFTNQKVTVGPPFYERVFGPISGGILILMVICPLAVWSYVSVKNLGRQLWKPLIVSLAGIILPLSGGLSYWPALIAFWLIAFVLAVNFIEFFRRIRLRHRGGDESVWRSVGRTLQRNQRSFSAMIIHIAVALMALGIVGIEFFQTETQGTIPQGGVLQLGSYQMSYDGLDVYETADARVVAKADIGVIKDGRVVGRVYPRRDYYYETGETVTLPGVRGTLVDDFYVILVDWKEVSQEGATFKVFHNPLVEWLWIGAGMFIIGVVAATWKGRQNLEPERLV